MIFARCGEMLLIIGPIPLVTVTGKMLLIIIVSVVFNLFIGIEASCEILLSPEHGKLQLFGNSQVDSIAVYSCDNGWKLVGASASKCLITGQWTSPPPKCVVEKSSSSFTTATAIVPTSTTVAAALPEPQVIPAENEEDDPQETFQQITYGKNCSCIYNSHDRKLSADVNGLGLWNGDKVGKGDKMTLRCYDQTKNLVLPNATSISGTLEFICNVCRVWEDSDLPSCVDVRSAIPAASVSVGQGVTSTVTSNNSPPKPIASQEISLGEEDDCFCTYNNPDRLLSAKYYNERLSYGDRVKKGTWTRLTCADQVMPLVLPNGTQITGGVLRLTCRVCETWEFDRLPTCEATYHPGLTCPQIVINGIEVKYSNGRKVGSTAIFSCANSFLELVVRNVTCLENGTWDNNQKPYCQRIRMPDEGAPNPPASTESNLEEDCVCTYRSHWSRTALLNGEQIWRDADIRKGESIQLGCTFNSQRLVLPNGTMITFESMPWTCYRCGEEGASEIPTCEKVQLPAVTCPQLEITEGITVKYTNERRVGSTATFSCTAPYVLHGQSTLRCLQAGEWNKAQPICLTPGCLIGDFVESAPKKLLPSMEGVTQELQPVGSELSMHCEEGWMLTENTMATCGRLGKWNFGKAQCVIGCQLNIEDKSSALIIKPENNYYHVGQSIILSCLEGFKLTSDVERVMCMADGWSNPIPNCKKETMK